ERLLQRERDVFVDRLGAAYHFYRTVIELGCHARLAFVLAPGDHADSGDQDHGRIGVPHGRRIRPFALLVIAGVVLPYCSSPAVSLRLSASRFSVRGLQSTYSGLILVRRKWSGQDVPTSASRGASWLFTKRRMTGSV